MDVQATKCGLRIETSLPFASAREQAIEALKENGFGILTEIDVRATMKEKLDVEFRDYVILGACKPPLAHRALSAEPNVGLLLPCNVIVCAEDDGKTSVTAIEPEVMATMFSSPELEAVAKEARASLAAALETIPD